METLNNVEENLQNNNLNNNENLNQDNNNKLTKDDILKMLGEVDFSSPNEENNFDFSIFKELARVFWGVYQSFVLKNLALSQIEKIISDKKIALEIISKIKIGNEIEKQIIDLTAKILQKRLKFQIPDEIILGLLLVNATKSYIDTAKTIAKELAKELKQNQNNQNNNDNTIKKKRGRPSKIKAV